MINQALNKFRSRLIVSTLHSRLFSLMMAIALTTCLLLCQSSQPIFANQSVDQNSSQTLPVSKLGIHILSPSELGKAKDLLTVSESNEVWHIVTIPLTIDDLQKEKDWKKFFQQAGERKIIPIIRLATRFENEVWIKPTRKNIVDQINFLSRMSWPGNRRYIIVGNEVNHATEWGGALEPIEYTNMLVFASQWAKAADNSFYILPAAMDLDAPNYGKTREAISFLREMMTYEPNLFEYIDGWNSHSYPNPAFSAPPSAIGKNSLRGYLTELALIEEYTDRQLPVFITETGWRQSVRNQRLLAGYYHYAARQIWSDPRIVAVTPFVLQGSPGPFANFSFLDAQQKPTAQYVAYQTVLKKLAEGSKLSGLLINDRVF